MIDKAARIASKQPALANAFMGTRVAKLLAGAHPERAFPKFAPTTLCDWFAAKRLSQQTFHFAEFLCARD